MHEMQVPSLGWEDPLEEDMATHSHSSILAGKISWTEEPDGLQSMGLQRVRHNWENTFFFFFNVDYFEEYCFFESVQEFHPKLVLSSSSLTP